MRKVHLILIDGMRPDALDACGSPFVRQLLSESLYTLSARTVFPSVTLPCHMSLFHSVDPERHGITTNTYTPQVRPINGLFEVLAPTKKTAMFYNWDQLRDLARPEKIACAGYASLHTYGLEASNRAVCEMAVECVKRTAPDFCFTYLGWLDEQGHKSGWMTPEYFHALRESFESVQQILEVMDEEDVLIVMADHGGHTRGHGTELDEDMTIPIILHGKGIPAGEITGPVSIKDVAPTIAKLLDCPPDPDWEGQSIL